MIQDKDLICSYQRTKSVWKTAKEFNLCGQYVHRKLSKLGVINKMNIFSDAEKKKLISIYSLGFKRGDGVLEKLAKELHRTKQFLCRQAKKLGLTNKNRICNERLCSLISENSKKYIATHGHTRGMLGKHHSAEFRDMISMCNKNKWASFSDDKKKEILLKRALARKGLNRRTNCSWKAGYRTIGGLKEFYRSKWEANYARYLQELKKAGIILSWEHEPDNFIMFTKEGKPTSYIPDFTVIRLVDGKKYYNYHEVKGWVDDRSKYKIDEFKKRYGDCFLNVIYANEYKKIEKEVASKIEEWEF